MSLCLQPLSPSPIGTGLILRECPADGGPAQPLQLPDLNPIDLIKRTVNQAREAIAPTVDLVERIINPPIGPVVLAGAALGATTAIGVAAALPAAAAAGHLARQAATGLVLGAAMGTLGALAAKALH